MKKNHPRVDVCGEVDELNAWLGLLISNLPANQPEITNELQNIQSQLFHVGGRLSGSPSSPLLESLRQIGEEDIRNLEESIDRMEEKLPPLTGFILPGGHPAAAAAHVSRTVCRRVERRATSLADGTESGRPDNVLIYLNRLSDYLFVLSRYINLVTGVPESLWERK